MSKVTYIEDIAKEVAEENNISYKEALEICELNIDYIYELIKDPAILTIRMPYLGNMYFNYKRGKYSVAFKKDEHMIKPRVSRLERLIKEEKDLAHGRNSYLAIFKKYFYPDREKRRMVKRKEIFTKIEEKQNR